MIHGTFVPVSAVNELLSEKHYLGSINRGMAWQSEDGVLVFANPTSRRLPRSWLELVRWCITSSRKNSGSMMWSQCVKMLKYEFKEVSTVVSYSDPSVGHTGALYRACNWLYAPTWHRLRPPPSGHGKWTNKKSQSVKDRWVFPLKDDPERVEILTIRDASILKNNPQLRYAEPNGLNFKAIWTQRISSR